MEKKPKIAVLAGFGINCEIETKYAFELAGAQARIVHLADLLSKKDSLSNYHCMAIPGGFSFGDDISSGRAYGNKLKYSLWDEMQGFIRQGKLIIGICNGFQILVKVGLLPNTGGKYAQEATLYANASGKFGDRWVCLKEEEKSKCIFTKGISKIYLPVRHGEGRFMARDGEVMRRLEENGQIALRYCSQSGEIATEYPANPNGSQEGIAGVCDRTGKVFGLMPHPECHIFPENHPRFARGESAESQMGIHIFRNAVKHIQKELL
ncbi:phosphoribosylformylglycinamidine synthase I [Candidatus Micrarchaeota archaeon CG1_02_47_40]|nr:MAG: phosphoribosylformylglycinamidine synthase I [Candidatus Micrarchaeota archaeon CG1_02_47_40]